MWLTPLVPFTRGEVTSHPFAFALHIFMAVVRGFWFMVYGPGFLGDAIKGMGIR